MKIIMWYNSRLKLIESFVDMISTTHEPNPINPVKKVKEMSQEIVSLQIGLELTSTKPFLVISMEKM